MQSSLFKKYTLCHGEKITSQKVRYISSLISTYYNLVLIRSDSSVLKVDDIRGYKTLNAPVRWFIQDT